MPGCRSLPSGEEDDRLDVAFAQQQEVVAVELDLETGLRQEQHPVAGIRRRGRRDRRAVTSLQTQRLGAGDAVAGISRPPREVRSPSSGFSTTMRSPVSRTAASASRRGLDVVLRRLLRPVASTVADPPADAGDC